MFSPARDGVVSTTRDAASQPHDRTGSSIGHPTVRLPADLVLRPRSDTDATALLGLLAGPDFDRNGCTLDPLTSVDDLEALLARDRPGNCQIVAAVDDAVVGFAGLYRLGGRQRHVASFTLCVHERWQRRGIGTALMKAVVRTGFAFMGLHRIQAMVFTDNTRALSLYERCGFVIEGRLARFALRGDGFIDAFLIALCQSGR